MFDHHEYLDFPINKEIKKFQAFFLAIRHDMIPSFIDYLKKLSDKNQIGHTIIGKEISKTKHKEVDGEHIHVFSHMTDTTYHTMSQVLFKKWKLRGRAGKDKPRQYGKVTGIRSHDKMIAYTIKYKNIMSTFIDYVNELKDYLAISFVKEDKFCEMKLLLLEKFSNDSIPDIQEIAEYVIQYHRDKKLNAPTYRYIKQLYENFRFDAQLNGKYIFTPREVWFILSRK